MGDSSAGQFSEPLIDAAHANDFDLVIDTKVGCPFVEVVAVGSSTAGPGCLHFVRQTVDTLKEKHPALVVIASHSSAHINEYSWSSLGPTSEVRDPNTGEVANKPEGKAELWETGLRSVLQELGDAGIPTLVVHSVPNIPGYLPEACPTVRIHVDVSGCAWTVPRTEIESQQRLARTAEQQAVDAVPTARGRLHRRPLFGQCLLAPSRR